MNNKLKRLLSLLLIVLSLFTLASCKVGEKTLEELLAEHDIKATVTYYANGGTFDDTGNLVTKKLYYKEDVEILDISESSVGATVAKSNYVLLGWFEAKTDGEGNIVYQDEAKTLPEPSDTPVTFPRKTKNGENLHFVAKWAKDVCIEYKFLGDFDLTLGEETYQNGDIFAETYFGRNTQVGVTNNTPFAGLDLKNLNGTVIKIYYDEACTEPIGTVVDKPTNGENLTLFVKFIEGRWQLVSNTTGVVNMFNNLGAGNRYYIMNDIDCSSLTNPVASVTRTKAKIEGNGFKISNLTVSMGTLTNGNTKSVFGTLDKSTTINDLTFENITVNATVRNNAFVNIYAITRGVETGATFNQFTIDGLTLNIEKPNDATLENIQLIAGAYNTENWLYGGVDKDSDFAVSGITVADASLVINGTTVYPTSSI